MRGREAGDLEVHDLNAGTVVAVDVALLLFHAHDFGRDGNTFGGDALGFDGFGGAPEGERKAREHEDERDRKEEPGHGTFGIAVCHIHILEGGADGEKTFCKAVTRQGAKKAAVRKPSPFARTGRRESPPSL